MKPYIIYIKEGPKDGYIKIKESELKNVIKKAYDDGYNAGYKDGKQNNWYWNTPTITTTGTSTYLNNTDKTPGYYKYEVTCSGETANSAGD